MSIIKKQIEAYRENFLENLGTPEGTFQNNLETQYLRFSRLIKFFRLEQENTIHDIGCGICDMYKYFKSINLKNFIYSGTEIVPEMVNYGKEKYKDIKIFNQDILKIDDSIKYDYLVLSGVFNLPGKTDRKEWKEFCFKMIDKMFELCNKAISFNFLTTNGTFQAPELFYLDPTEVFNYCLKKHSRFVVLDNNYPLYEFTITVYNAKEMEKEFDSKPFKKYFKNNNE
ncbi:class I SAM-dependent methyltransferase [Polaribacter aquimarinus]|uniref:Methyltransferase domain-containing protein n=1 Tax=Polaribacter aquimarinus TaxID=2100726 RepID=A0A2U2J7I1_9FLAO|nr:hypothetical protein [Polaribacter aquimarinus]PWG04262.1 hypothetical protein DIS07_12675 [Polaribacter aquimarinus]